MYVLLCLHILVLHVLLYWCYVPVCVCLYGMFIWAGVTFTVHLCPLLSSRENIDIIICIWICTG